MMSIEQKNTCLWDIISLKRSLRFWLFTLLDWIHRQLTKAVGLWNSIHLIKSNSSALNVTCLISTMSTCQRKSRLAYSLDNLKKHCWLITETSIKLHIWTIWTARWVKWCRERKWIKKYRFRGATWKKRHLRSTCWFMDMEDGQRSGAIVPTNAKSSRTNLTAKWKHLRMTL